MYWLPKDKKIQNILDRFTQNTAFEVDADMARTFCKYREGRYLRKKKHLVVAKDHRLNTSIMYLKGVKIRKKGNKYFFDGL